MLVGQSRSDNVRVNYSGLIQYDPAENDLFVRYLPSNRCISHHGQAAKQGSSIFSSIFLHNTHQRLSSVQRLSSMQRNKATAKRLCYCACCHCQCCHTALLHRLAKPQYPKAAIEQPPSVHTVSGRKCEVSHEPYFEDQIGA